MKKRLISLLLTVCVIASLFSCMTVAAGATGTLTIPADTTIEYTVKEYDRLYQICNKLGYNYNYPAYKAVIWDLNGFTSEGQAGSLSPKQVLVLPKNLASMKAIIEANPSAVTPPPTTTVPTTPNPNTVKITSNINTARSIEEDETVSFAISVSKPVSKVTITWYKNDASVATGAAYSFTAAKSDNGATISATVKDSETGETVTSNICTLTVISTTYKVASGLTEVVEIKSGDTLDKLCTARGIRIGNYQDVIMALNGFSSTAQLSKVVVGQKVTLPVSEAAAKSLRAANEDYTGVGSTTPGSSSTTPSDAVLYYMVAYTFKSGDTVNKVCASMGTSYSGFKNVILTANNLTQADRIRVGQTLWLPSKSAPSGGTYYTIYAHTMKSGEACYKVCQKFGTTYGAVKTMITAVNPGVNLDKLKVGQVLNVPVLFGSGSTVPGGSGSASDATVKYGLSKDGVNCTVKLVDNTSTEISAATKGSLVTIKITPDTGKSVSQVRLVLDGGLDMTLNSKADGTYSFAMPACAVSVEVSCVDNT